MNRAAERAIVALQEARERAALLARQFHADCRRYAHAELNVMPGPEWDAARSALRDGSDRFARSAIGWQECAAHCYVAAWTLLCGVD